mmetsp:Transcript_19464/g.36302  ORF Transcript_19464/g.36302 Transcript_19464/m.36302 type:complete len:118 (-) Transcript_19464:41-394(-)
MTNKDFQDEYLRRQFQRSRHSPRNASQGRRAIEMREDALIAMQRLLNSNELGIPPLAQRFDNGFGAGENLDVVRLIDLALQISAGATYMTSPNSANDASTDEGSERDEEDGTNHDED